MTSLPPDSPVPSPGLLNENGGKDWARAAGRQVQRQGVPGQEAQALAEGLGWGRGDGGGGWGREGMGDRWVAGDGGGVGLGLGVGRQLHFRVLLCEEMRLWLIRKPRLELHTWFHSVGHFRVTGKASFCFVLVSNCVTLEDLRWPQCFKGLSQDEFS